MTCSLEVHLLHLATHRDPHGHTSTERTPPPEPTSFKGCPGTTSTPSYKWYSRSLSAQEICLHPQLQGVPGVANAPQQLEQWHQASHSAGRRESLGREMGLCHPLMARVEWVKSQDSGES